MTKKITGIILATIIMAVVAVSTSAQVTKEIRTNIPFDFTAGGVQLPAGDYVINYGTVLSNNDAIVISTAKGKAVAIVAIKYRQISDVRKQSGVSFRKIGGRYELKGVALDSVRLQMAEPKRRLPLLAVK